MIREVIARQAEAEISILPPMTHRRTLFHLVFLACALTMQLSCSVGSHNKTTPTRTRAAPSDPVTLSAQQRAEALVEQMTREEKFAYLGGDREFYIRPIKRLGIPEIKMADGPAGCRNWGPSTAYPATIGLAASFDRALTEKVGASIARDCRARGVHILLAPGVNIQRSPRSGRNFEYMGEDPFLAKETAVHFIQGVQNGGVLATVKHFAANNQEWDRNHVGSEVSERALHEIYFSAFEGAVKEANVGAIMTAYNPLNGTFSSHNSYLLRQVLRDEWNFKGFVMSDWSAVHNALGAVRGGLDLEMPSGHFMSAPILGRLIDSGQIQESEIDEKVLNILRTLIEANFFDRKQEQFAPVDDSKSAAIALEAAEKSIVLLKNEKVEAAPLLPLDAADLKRIAVIGPNAHPAVHGGSGSAYVTPSHVVSLLDGIKQVAPHLEISHHPGIQEEAGFGSIGRAVFSGPVKQEIFNNKTLEGPPTHLSHVNAINFQPKGKSPAEGINSEHYSIRWTGKVRVNKSQMFQLMTNADDGVRVFVNQIEVLNDWSDHAPRMKSSFVELNPATHTIVVEYYQGRLGAICQFGFGPKVESGSLYGHDALKQTLSNVDAVIVAVGYGQSTASNSMGVSYEPYWPNGWARDAGIVEAEDDDRSFALPQAQVATLKIAAQLNKKVIVIGYAGGGVDFEPWLGGISALLWTWYPGQEGGTAIAETLFGQNNPSARLPVTFAKKYEDHPAAPFYSTRHLLVHEEERGSRPLLEKCAQQPDAGPFKKHDKSAGYLYYSPYCEDSFVGYRGFDRAKIEPAFPFGFGLSYSTFSYSRLVTHVGTGGHVAVRFSIKNTSQIPGREVVQVYVAPLSEGPSRPPQQLAAFSALELKPGEEKTVELALSDRSFGIYRTGAQKGWTIPAGNYELRVGVSSRDARLDARIQLQGRELKD